MVFESRDLSKDAVELLRAAVESVSGPIKCIPHRGVTLISAGGKDFTGGGTARESARWRNALSELEDAGLVEPQSSDGRLLQVTHRGYNLFEGKPEAFDEE